MLHLALSIVLAVVIIYLGLCALGLLCVAAMHIGMALMYVVYAPICVIQFCISPAKFCEERGWNLSDPEFYKKHLRPHAGLLVFFAVFCIFMASLMIYIHFVEPSIPVPAITLKP